MNAHGYDFMGSQKPETIKMYQKSIELNPQNEKGKKYYKSSYNEQPGIKIIEMHILSRII